MINKIQEAYETLTDPEKRKKYDCSLEFNDAIPEKFDVSKDDFFEIFGPIFRRNGYFSKKQPVLQVGNLEDSLKKTLQFYDFWESFDSWREFVHEDEYDVNQAEGRSERRWMEQENRRLKSTLIKAEKMRISKLVNFAYNNDPRIQVYLRKQEEEKELKKTEKKNFKEKQKLEEQMRRDEILKTEQEKIHKIEEQKRQEIEQKQNRIAKKKEIDRQFRKNVKLCVKGEKIDDYYVDEIIFKCKEEDLTEITEMLSSKEEWLQSDFEELTRNIISKKTKFDENSQTLTGKMKSPEVLKLEWTQQEINLLTKGVVKFPSGIMDRWKRIAQYIGGRFTEVECCDKAKIMKTQHIKDLKKKEEDLKPVKEPEINVKDPIQEKIEIQNSETQKEKDIDVANWSQEHQKMLEVALKKYPANLPAKERWEKIASEVPDKTMKECVERFKYLKDRLKK